MDKFVHDIISAIQGCLSEDLLKKEYRNSNKHFTYGHCYVASEALYYCLKDLNPCVYRAKDKNNITHWWLVLDGVIIDPTAEQYDIPPYENGRRSFFLTNKPSKRCQILLERLGVVGHGKVHL